MKSTIAIVGIGGVFPDAPDLDRFWQMILDRQSACREVPEGRWPVAPETVFQPGDPCLDKVYSLRGCFVDGAALQPENDPLVSDAEILRGLDPVFELGLTAAVAAWRDAKTKDVDPLRVAVVIGNIVLPTEKASALANEILGRTLEERVLGRPSPDSGNGTHPLNAFAAGLPAAIIARALGLGGGAYTLDAACASSLFALKFAVMELLNGRADAVIGGGLSRPDCLYTQMGFSQLRALSPSGTPAPFDANADGLVVGEGAGMFVLKRLEDALSHGDRIYGTVAGIGLSNDRDGSLLAPSSEGQLRAMREAYRQAGWSPDSVDHIECHATGTPLGDAVELRSLGQLWRGSESEKKAVIGSVKANVGHLLTAAGGAALVKTLLALKHRMLPPTAGFAMPTPKFDLASSPFRVLTRAEPWPDPGRPRRAAVSAFGFGGINAHVLIEEWRGPEKKSQAVTRGRTKPEPVAVIGIGARFGTEEGLASLQRRMFSQNREVPNRDPKWWGIQDAAWFARQGLRAPEADYIRTLDVPFGKFRIPPREIAEMLPQQLLMLLVADEAMADAGLREPDLLSAGIFIGLGLDLNTTNYQLRWNLEARARTWNRELGLGLEGKAFDDWVAGLRDAASPGLTANRTIGGLGGIVASRIARELGFGGPCFSISSEESSALRALDAAVGALRDGTVSLALAGGVDFAGEPRNWLAFRKWMAMRGVNADSLFQPGDGAGAVILKRYGDAVRDGDRIVAAIRGMGAASATGKPNLEPDRSTLERSFRAACEEAGIDPQTIGYCETAGAGDRETAARIRDQKTSSPRTEGLCTGPESELGRCGAASGMASLVRACLALREKTLPRQSEPPAPPMLWLRNRAEGPRRAAVGAFGLDGTGVHAVLEACETGERIENREPWRDDPDALFFVEGDRVPDLIHGLDELRNQAAAWSGSTLTQFAASRAGNLQTEKKRAVALLADCRETLLQRLDTVRQAFAAHSEDPLRDTRLRDLVRKGCVFYEAEPLGPDAKIAFVFPGSGNHFSGMGRELALRWPDVFHGQDALTGHFAGQIRPDLFWRPGTMRIEDQAQNHAALLSAQVALGVTTGDLIRGFGIEPRGVVGYSLGETAGLFAMRAWTDRDGMYRRTRESTLFSQALAGPCTAVRQAWKLAEHERVDWVIGVVNRPADRVRALLADRDRVYLLIVNTHKECVLGGDRSGVESAVRDLGADFFPLKGVVTVHCQAAAPVAEAYRAHHLFETEAPRDVRFYSGAWGKAYTVTRESAADSILAQALTGLDFPKTVEAAYADGFRIFLEMGPGASCTRMIGSILESQPHLAHAVCGPGPSEVTQVLRLLAKLIAARVPLNLDQLYGFQTEEKPQKEPVRKTMTLTFGGDPFQVPMPPKRRETEKVIPFPKKADQKRRGPVAPPSEPEKRTRPEAPTRTQQELQKNDGLAETENAIALAHERFLQTSRAVEESYAAGLSYRMSLLERFHDLAQNSPAIAPERVELGQEEWPSLLPAESPVPVRDGAPFMDREQCLAFARGSIAEVLGSRFAEVDRHPTRVRLPDEPLMLVDRILTVEGEAMTHGRVVTEHDILPGAWYLDAGRIASCIAIEAGQADLFLSAWLGIDFRTKGRSMYRLLDAAVTFHGELPGPGATIRYDIRIDRFFRQGDTHFFRFRFDGSVDGAPLLTMRDGCAGFFSSEELEAGKGIVEETLGPKREKRNLPEDWVPLAPMGGEESYGEARVEALRRGDLAGCFGPAFAALPLKRPAGLPGEKMRLVHRVASLQPRGGRYGLGYLRAEADIHPDDWFLTCHFVDDRVMPGTLMYECCLHSLRIFLYRLGWVGEEGTLICQPVPGVTSRLKCRGQVLETTRMVTYEVEIKELGYRPEPYAVVDAFMYSDGKKTVEIADMSLRLGGLTRETLLETWGKGSTLRSGPQFDRAHFETFATGKPSEAFGEAYRPFDDDRFIARLPAPPFLFLDRVTELRAEPWVMAPGAEAVTQCDVPADAWYFEAERGEEMPYVVLLEIALQSCGWLAAYMGSALHGEADLHFRNLGGSARQYRAVTRRSGTLTTTVKAEKISKSAGMIIHHYAFRVRDAQGPVYEGQTYFGFFTAAALANQVGIRDAEIYRPDENVAAGSETVRFPRQAPFADDRLAMIDTLETFLPRGGPHGLGYLRGVKRVDPADWFFKAHFFRDPVIPGSLGLESLLQLLKWAAVELWGGDGRNRFQAVTAAEAHRWTYRGQVVPQNERVTVDAWITRRDDGTRTLTADGYLSVDGKPIYHMQGFSLRLK